MEAITRIESLTSEIPGQPLSAPEDTLATLEHFIDRMVTAENNLAKAAAQEAIKQRQIREEFERRLTYLSSRLHEAESALAALEESLSRVEPSPGENELLNTKRNEVVFWRTQLREICPPGSTDLLI